MFLIRLIFYHQKHGITTKYIYKTCAIFLYQRAVPMNIQKMHTAQSPSTLNMGRSTDKINAVVFMVGQVFIMKGVY